LTVSSKGGVRVRRQAAHLSDDPLAGVLVERRAGGLGQHRERGALGRGEVDVPTGQPTDEVELQHLREPLSAQRAAAERLLEQRVEWAEVE
jgi:hypothetical protein